MANKYFEEQQEVSEEVKDNYTGNGYIEYDMDVPEEGEDDPLEGWGND